MCLRATSIAIIAAFFIAAAPAHCADDAALNWDKPIISGSQTMSHLLTAVSGKPNSERTDSLLVGVKAIVREQNNFRIVRSDGAELVVPRDTEMGERMFACMEKIEHQARAKVGNELGDYVHNLDTLTIDGDSIELHHTGKEDVHVPLPGNQPWLPVHLKELHLRNIRLKLVEGKDKKSPHQIKSIDGIACVVRSTGIDINIEPREFWRWKDRAGRTHICFGIKSLIPQPIRLLFNMPEVMHFRYTFKKKHERAEVATTNNSEQAAPKSAPAGQPGS